MTEPKTPGARIALSLEELGMTKTEAAQKLGLSAGYISHLTNGRKRPSTRVILQLENTLGIPRIWVEKGVGPSVAVMNRVPRAALDQSTALGRVLWHLDQIQDEVSNMADEEDGTRHASAELHELLDKAALALGDRSDLVLGQTLRAVAAAADPFGDPSEFDDPTERA